MPEPEKPVEFDPAKVRFDLNLSDAFALTSVRSTAEFLHLKKEAPGDSRPVVPLHQYPGREGEADNDSHNRRRERDHSHIRARLEAPRNSSPGADPCRRRKPKPSFARRAGREDQDGHEELPMQSLRDDIEKKDGSAPCSLKAHLLFVTIERISQSLSSCSRPTDCPGNFALSPQTRAYLKRLTKSR